jgi:hypothetical protein
MRRDRPGNKFEDRKFDWIADIDRPGEVAI